MLKLKIDALKRECRFMFLLYFCRFACDDVVETIYEEHVVQDEDSALFQWAYWQLGEFIKGWKCSVINNMIVTYILR